MGQEKFGIEDRPRANRWRNGPRMMLIAHFLVLLLTAERTLSWGALGAHTGPGTGRTSLLLITQTTHEGFAACRGSPPADEPGA